VSQPQGISSSWGSHLLQPPSKKKNVLKTSKKLKTLKNGSLGRATVPWSLKGIGVCETALYNQRNSEFKFLARVISRKFRFF
jgi:hypothetical protein